MAHSIISLDAIRAHARAEFGRGGSRDAHNQVPGSPAHDEWLAEYDRCALAWYGEPAEVSPP
jgi:hypothetical protein